MQMLKSMIVSLLSFNLAGCALLGCFNQSSSKYHENTFVFLENDMNAKICMPETKIEDCIEISWKTRSSGVVFQKDATKTLILTAGHSCAGIREEELEKLRAIGGQLTVTSVITVASFKGEISPAKIVKLGVDEIGKDLCVLQADTLPTFEVAELADQDPSYGDDVTNVSAPLGLFQPNSALIFTGQYVGNQFGLSLFSLPARPGSSGSAILDSSGRIVGIVILAMNNLESVAICVSLEDIKKFLSETNN